MTEYASQMKEHLAAYKRQRLANVPDGIWRSNQQTYPHILPEESHHLNIVDTVREEFWQYFDEHKAELPLHTDFHHLNSSQAFAFNLFFIWMRDSVAQAALLQALGVRVGSILDWRFEHMPDQSERTTLDFYAEYSDASRVLIEVKLTESKFGAAEANERHCLKRIETYLPRLVGKVSQESLNESNFFLNYQLFRNLSHLDLARGDQLVLLAPRGNAFTWSQANRFLDFLLPEYHSAVHVVAVEDLLERLAESATVLPELYQQHCTLLIEKYVPAN